MCHRPRNSKDLYIENKENEENFIEIDGSCRNNYNHQLKVYDETKDLVYCRRCDIIYYYPQSSIKNINIKEDRGILTERLI